MYLKGWIYSGFAPIQGMPTKGSNPFVLLNTLFDVFDIFLAVEFAAVTNVPKQYGILHRNPHLSIG